MQHRAQRDRGAFKLLPDNTDLGQEQRVIKNREDSMPGPFKNALELVVIRRRRHLAQNKLAGPEQAIERSAEFMRNEVQEVTFCAIDDGEPLICLGKFTCAGGYGFFQVFILPLQCPLEVVELEMGFDAGVNFVELEGLGNIIHRSRVKSRYLVGRFAESAQ